MSLILDALRKSEAERQRGQAPGLFVQQALPARRRRSPAAAWGGVALALVAIVALGWFGWQRFGATDDATTADIVAAPGDTSMPGGVAEESAMPTTTPATATPAPASAATPAPTPAPASDAMSAPGDLGPVVDTRPPNEIPASRGSRAMAAARDAAASVEPMPAPTPAAAAPTPAPAANESSALPRLADLGAGERASLPPLKLSMHVYAEDPAQRFVILDGRRLGEGAALAEGVFVQSIRRDGLVVSVRGQPYWLAR